MIITAIVIQAKPILEHDLLVELFSIEWGKVRAFAKYAQSKKPRFGGIFNTLNVVEASISMRGSAMHIQTARLINGFHQLKQSYQRMNVAYTFLKVIQSTAQAQQESMALFKVLIQSLTSLELGADDIHAIKHSFYQSLLVCEGVCDDGIHSEKNCVSMLESYANIRIKDTT